MATLRQELLRFPTEDGGLDVLDLLFERIIHLRAEDVAGLAADDPTTLERFASDCLTLSPQVDAMREAAYRSRLDGARPPRESPPPAEVDWSEAADLDAAFVSEGWRDGERRRRLAEDHAAGTRYLRLPGFLHPDAARELAAAAHGLAWSRLETELVRGDRKLLKADDLEAWQSFLRAPLTRRVLGGLIGRVLPETLTVNAWRLQPGDAFGVHPDGRLYRGTISVGLCEGWTAGDGGAIAFGDPTGGGFVVRERWLPHLGDVALFAPTRDTWHCVEPVVSRPRLTLTGWWTETP